MRPSMAGRQYFSQTNPLCMIEKQLIENVVNDAIKGTDAFVTEITVSPSNDIVVELDSPSGVDLDFCSLLSRRLDEELEKVDPTGDYSLEVGTASLSAPFKVAAQYDKHLGDDIDILTKDGRKLTGVLTGVDAAARTFTVELTRKVKDPDKKKPRTETYEETLGMDECKSVAYHFSFK